MSLHTWLLRGMLNHVGSGVSIHPSVWIESPEQIYLSDNCEIRREATLIGTSEREIGIELGKGVHIHPYAFLNAYGGFIKLGEGVRIGHFTVIAGHGGVVFGPYSGVAGQSYVISSNHQFKDTKIPHVYQEETKKGITVGTNVWGGSGVIILDGVRIGDNSVIGAGSVVRRNVPDNCVVLGNPARVAYRFSAPQVQELELSNLRGEQ
jgi:acetyltransferase-like isoleucine patch superfamily enzyme